MNMVWRNRTDGKIWTIFSMKSRFHVDKNTCNLIIHKNIKGPLSTGIHRAFFTDAKHLGNGKCMSQILKLRFAVCLCCCCCLFCFCSSTIYLFLTFRSFKVPRNFHKELTIEKDTHTLIYLHHTFKNFFPFKYLKMRSHLMNYSWNNV